MKLLHLLTIIFFMFFVACSSPSSSNEEQEVVTEETTKETVIEKETPTEELIQVDAKAISKEIGENVIAVEIKYMGKEVIVTNCKVLGIVGLAILYWFN